MASLSYKGDFIDFFLPPPKFKCKSCSGFMSMSDILTMLKLKTGLIIYPETLRLEIMYAKTYIRA
jgi:hypothetical protein